MQGNFKYPRIMKIQQVHTSRVTNKTILIILLNLFSICNTFKFQATGESISIYL